MNPVLLFSFSFSQYIACALFLIFSEAIMITQTFKTAARTMLGAVIGGAIGAAVGATSRAIMTGSIVNGTIEGAVAGAVSGAISANTRSYAVGALGVIGASALTAITVAPAIGADPGATIVGGSAVAAWMSTRAANLAALRL